jgi:hypothetical protein
MVVKINKELSHILLISLTLVACLRLFVVNCIGRYCDRPSTYRGQPDGVATSKDISNLKVCLNHTTDMSDLRGTKTELLVPHVLSLNPSPSARGTKKCTWCSVICSASTLYYILSDRSKFSFPVWCGICDMKFGWNSDLVIG